MTEIEDQVCGDIAKRQKLGIAKYGVTVANNPLDRRQWLQHAYEEALDLAVYLKRLIEMEDPPCLEAELAGFEECKEDLAKQTPGYYVLIKGDQVCGTWERYSDAIDSGYKRFGLKPFLVSQLPKINTSTR